VCDSLFALLDLRSILLYMRRGHAFQFRNAKPIFRFVCVILALGS
jgi:hypothetical protein